MCIESVCSEWLCILLLWDYCYILDRKQLLVRWPGLWFISWFFAVKKSKNVSKRRKKLRRRRRYLYHFSMIWWDLSVWADAVSLKKLHYIPILRFTGIVNDVSLYIWRLRKKRLWILEVWLEEVRAWSQVLILNGQILVNSMTYQISCMMPNRGWYRGRKDL